MKTFRLLALGVLVTLSSVGALGESLETSGWTRGPDASLGGWVQRQIDDVRAWGYSQWPAFQEEFQKAAREFVGDETAGADALSGYREAVLAKLDAAWECVSPWVSGVGDALGDANAIGAANAHDLTSPSRPEGASAAAGSVVDSSGAAPSSHLSAAEALSAGLVAATAAATTGVVEPVATSIVGAVGAIVTGITTVATVMADGAKLAYAGAAAMVGQTLAQVQSAAVPVRDIAAEWAAMTASVVCGSVVAVAEQTAQAYDGARHYVFRTAAALVAGTERVAEWTGRTWDDAASLADRLALRTRKTYAVIGPTLAGDVVSPALSGLH